MYPSDPTKFMAFNYYVHLPKQWSYVSPTNEPIFIH